jgi:hypothetical protein
VAGALKIGNGRCSTGEWWWSLSPADGPAFMFPRLFGAVRAPRMLADLLSCVRDWKPDLIVHDAAEFAGAIAAAAAAVPAVTHSFGALAEKSFRERARQLTGEIAGMPQSSTVAGIIRTQYMQ